MDNTECIINVVPNIILLDSGICPIQTEVSAVCVNYRSTEMLEVRH